MSSIEVKTFDNPDESNTSFNNAKMDIVKIGDQRVMRLVYNLVGNGHKILNQL